jgi:hypothetical protein
MTFLYNLIHLLRYGRPQVSVFNDLSSKEQVKIIRGAMQKSKKIQDKLVAEYALHNLQK